MIGRASCILFALATLFVSAPSAWALHSTFLYKVDRFEIVGNQPVSLVDDFGDGVLSPWTNNPTGSFTYGTAFEADGFAVLSNPGFHDGNPLAGAILDRSDIFASAPFAVEDGLGDFVATTTWAPIVPDQLGFYSMSLHTQIGGTLAEGILVGISNADAAIASIFGIPEGLAITQSRIVWDAPTTNPADTTVVSLQQESVAISLEDITGDIRFRFSFNDSANVITTSYSLNNSTFETPFASVSSSMTGTGIWNLAGGSGQVIPEPSAFLLLASGVGALAVHRRLALRVSTGRRRP